MANDILNSRTSQRGVYLLEVLVAVLVFSLGLLGLLGLLMNSMKISSTSNYRTVAAQEAGRMADTMRANVTSLAAFATPATSCSSPLTENVSCYQSTATGGGCTPAQIVCNEYAAWTKRLADLPGGEGSVCRGTNPPATDSGGWACTGGNAAPFVVKVCWDESRVGNSTTAGTKTCVYAQL